MALRKRFMKRRSAKTAKAVPKTTKKYVKSAIQYSKPKQICHNGYTAAAQVLGNQVVPVANFWQNVQSFTDIIQGNSEFQRHGDQLYVHRLRLRAYVTTVAPNETFRLAIMRQKSTGQTPAPINPNLSYQVVTPGIQGTISALQDDKNVSVLFDKVYDLGDAAGMKNGRFINIDLKFKNPLPLVFYDGTITPTVLSTVIGNIAMCVTSAGGSPSFYYQWDITFSEK